MDITATLKINKNHLTYKQAHSVATTAALYFEQVTTNMTGPP